MKITICHMTSVHHVSDPRIFLKECGSLARAGFDVYLVAPHNRAETIRDVHIVPFRTFKSRLLRIMLSPFAMLAKGLKLNAEIYHLHDPELQITGFLLKLLGRRVVFDSHEMVHMDLGDKYYLKGGFLKKLIPAVYRRIEALAIRFFDGFVLAEDGYKDYFFSKYRRYEHKFEFLRNYPALRLIDSIPPAKKEAGRIAAGNCPGTGESKNWCRRQGSLKVSSRCGSSANGRMRPSGASVWRSRAGVMSSIWAFFLRMMSTAI